MRIGLIFILCLTLAYNTNAQTGYYGNLNLVEFSYSAAPSLKAKTILKIQGQDTIFRQKRRFLNSSFNLNYSRIIDNKIMIGFGYTFSNIKILSDKIVNDFNAAFNFATVTMPYHGLTFNLKYFKSGNISPVGKYIGFKLEYGSANFKLEDYQGTYSLTPISSSFFKLDSKAANIIDGTSELLHEDIKTFYIKGLIGRNLPITKRLYLNLEGSFNILGISFYQGEYSFSRLSNLFNTSNDLLYDNTAPNKTTLKESRNNKTISNSIFAYKRLTFTFGLNYSF